MRTKIIRRAAVLLSLAAIVLVGSYLVHSRIMYESETLYMKEFCRAEAILFLSGREGDQAAIRCDISSHDILVDFEVVGSNDLKLSCHKDDTIFRPTELRNCAFYTSE